MGRPKGSKNKPKYNLDVVVPGAEMGDFVIMDTQVSAKNAQVQQNLANDLTSSEPVKKKRHRRTKAEMEAYRASLKAQSTIESEFEPEPKFEIDQTQDKINSNFNKIINNLDSRNLPTLSDHITAYQESKAEINQETLINNQEKLKVPETQENQGENSTPKKSKQNKKVKSTYPLCDCCHQEIYCQPHRIDTNMITAQVADYHRESPRWVNLCSSCAKKLSDTVDNWLQKNGCITRMEQRMLEKEKQE